MLKKIFYVLIGLVLVLVIGGYFVWSNMGAIVKAEIQKYGTAATQAEVTLDDVVLSLPAGEGSLNGLSIGNPKGFSTSKAFYMGLITLKLDPASVAGSGPIVIDEITIDKPQINFEIAANGQSNLQTLEQNTKAYAQGLTKPDENSGEAAGAPNNAAPPAPSAARKFIIKNLYIRDGQIAINQPMLKGKNLTANLSVIHLTDIGAAQGGATPAQIADIVLGSLTSTASQFAGSALTKQLGTDALKNLPTGQAGDALKNLMGH